MLFRRYQPAAVLGLTSIRSANSRTLGQWSMTSWKSSGGRGFLLMDGERSTKRTLLQVRSVRSPVSSRRDKMYDVKAPEDTRRRAYTEKLSVRIEAIRNGLNLEPKEMAEKLNLNYETYRSYENGERMMPPYVMVDLVKVSGYSAWFVLNGEPEKREPLKLAPTRGPRK